MDHKHYNRILLTGIGILVLFFTAFRFLNKSIEDQWNIQTHAEMRKMLISQNPPEEPSFEHINQRRLLNASDPQQYHIAVQTQNKLIQNQRHWDLTTKKTLQQSDVIERMSQGSSFKGIKKTPEQFEKQLQRIDRRIREYEQKISGDPGDNNAHQKLQDLYMLRATVNVLEEAVVKK